MTDNTIEAQIDALDDLLDDERSALLEGDIDRISRLHGRKAELIDHLSKLDREDSEHLHALGQKVGRNQELLNSAADGIRSVARRLAEIRETRSKLDTYGSDGRKKSYDMQPKRSLEKRA